MIKGINYWAFGPGPDGGPLDPVAAMETAKRLGYDALELTVEAEGRVSLDTSESDAAEIRREAERIGIRLLTAASGLAWGCSPTHPDASVRDRAVEQYRKIIRVAGWLGVETLLYLPGMVSAVFVEDYPPQPYDEVDARARAAIGKLLPAAEEAGVKLGVENVWNRYLLSPVEMSSLIDSFSNEYLGAYFDIGNVLLYGHPEHWIRILGSRIFAVHAKDFRVGVGNLDGFVDLLSGDVDYPAVMGALGDIGYAGPMTAEIVPPTPGCAAKAIAALEIIEGMGD
jgi:hexulose-6-phosphate isomerase